MIPLIAEIINKLKPNERNVTNIDIENLEDIFTLDENQDNLANANNDENQDNSADANKKKINLDKPMQTLGMLKKVKNTLYQAMLFYWNNDHEISYLPSILDSQIKKLDFASYEMERTLCSLKKKYDDMKFSMSSRLPLQSPQSPQFLTPFTPFPTSTPSTLY
ncbi:11901_t:CDS:1 [Funneliformis geosporum]|nr:11901_t:CDS:1 [Funneliformis geosporum]